MKIRQILPRLGMLMGLLVVLGCGDEHGSAAPGVAVPFHPAAAGATRFGDIPWPSDLYLTPAGYVGEVPGLDRLVSMPAILQQGLSALSGFGRSAGALFFVDAAIDEASLPSTWEEANARRPSVLIVDVDPSSQRRGRRYAAYAKYLPGLGCLSVIPVPGIVLPPGVRHAAVLTARVRTAEGAALAADEELRRIADLPAAQRVTAAERLYGDAMADLVATRAVAHVGEIASLAVFTTSRQVEELPLLRRRLASEREPELILDPAAAAPYTVAIFGAPGQPTLDQWLGFPSRDERDREWPGTDNPGGIAHDQIGVIASGVFVAPSFLDPVTHHFEPDGTGSYRLANEQAKIPVTLMLPKAPAPASGYPVVINGHGLSNHRGSMLGVSNELARAGFAVIAIDDVQHGARQGIRDLKNNYGGSYVGPDGIPDAFGLPIAFFAGFSDFVATRDNFRQTILDETSLVRLIRSSRLDLSPLVSSAGGAAPRLDPERIFWSGGSLGGIMGTMTIAVEPHIRAAALQVPGAGFIQLITTSSAELAPLVGTLARSVLGVRGEEPIDELHPVALLLAAITEAGDPIAYAPHVLEDALLPERQTPDVLISYALYDEVLPNIATVALIRALQLPLATPQVFALPGIPEVAAPVVGNLPSGRTAAAVQYLPANHNLGYSRYDTRKFRPSADDNGFQPLAASFTFEQPIREHLQQVVTFFESALDGDPARIEVTAPPRADYDGDGILDRDELAAHTDPYQPQH